MNASIDYAVANADIAFCRDQAGSHDLALVIALGGLSQKANVEAQRSGALPIKILDRSELVQALVGRRVNIRSEVVEAHEIGPYF